MSAHRPVRKSRPILSHSSLHMPLTRYVDTTNGRQKECSLDLYQFLNHINTPIRSRTIEEVASEAERRAYQIFTYWDKLHAILLEHENTLRTRWIKKNQDQRKKILMAAWPNMAASHRPDFQALARESVEERRASTKFRKEFLFPYINLEDLLKARNLLLYFQSRGHTKPDVFAHHDLMAALLGRRSTAIQPPYVDGYTMFFCGMLVPEAYGSLSSWDEEPFGFTDYDAFRLLLSGVGWHPGDGLLIMEIQETILGFLVQCAELILRDLLPLKVPSHRTSLYSSKPSKPQQPPPPPITPIPSEATWASVASATVEAPYRVPVQFDVLRLQRLIDAKRAEADDHIWALREDPGIFQETVNNWAQHRQEVMLNKHGKPHPTYNTPEYWNRMLRYVVQCAYQKLIMWDILKKSLIRLDDLRQRFQLGQGIRITPLPWEYAQELSHLSYTIRRLRPMLLSDFQGIVASPPLRDYYVREDIDIPNVFLIKRKIDPPAGSFLLHFLYLVNQFQTPEQLELVGIYNFLDEFERLSRNAKSLGGPKDNLISPFIASAISELAVVSEVERQLDWHQPRILPGTVSKEDKEDEYNRRAKLMTAFDSIELKLYDVGAPLLKMKYPAEKRRTAVTVQKMREAETALDNFWQNVDEHYKGKKGKVLGDLFSEILTSRQLQRTAEWVEPTLPPTESNNVLKIAPEQFSTIGLDEPSSRTYVHAPKIKVKTRGPSAETGAADEVPQVTQATEPQSATIGISKRAFEMFSLIFNTDNQELPGEIPWTEFLHGMSSAGFSIEKQHGSAWLFTPSDATQRSIIFHAPHPTNKIPIYIARRHGRRLTRAYGWSAKTFSLSR